uniref:NRF domain-containing protein n=1 Tax=Caenorhabditis tropicalis TaxID=1561998 RepID=A0A1I7U2T8_9PELO
MKSFFLFLILILSTKSDVALRTLLSNSLQLTANLKPGQCYNETSLFIDSIREVAKITDECLEYKNCTLMELSSVQDYVFAIQQLDAFGKLPSDVLDINTFFEGSPDECRRVSGKKYPTSYSYLVAYFGANASCDSHEHITPRFGVCMPSSCDEQDLVEIFNQLTPFPLKACKAYRADLKVEKKWPFWAFTCFLASISALVISASFVDYFREREIGMSAVNEHAYFLRVFLSFSLWSNAELILSIQEHKPDSIRSLDCIRTLTILWIIFAHVYSFKFPYNNVGDSMEFLENPSRQLIMNSYFSIDTLFVISGVLEAYSFFWNKPKEAMIRKPLTWMHFYLRRYIRSAPPLMAFIAFFTIYAKFIQGPFVASELNVLTKEAEICESNWWRNALYINNFAGDNNCYRITWLLAVDTQLFLVAPLVIVSLFFSMTGGVILIVGGCLASVFAEYILFGVYELPADFVGNGHHELFRSVVYEMPWTRAPSFLLGMLVGYFLANFTKTRLKFHSAVPISGWLIAIGIAGWCLWGNYSYDSGNPWSVYQRATYFNFSKIGWTLFVSWIIIANHYGWGGPVGNFMCHPIWQPFGRLSYCAYIVHRMTMFWFFNLDGMTPHAHSALQMFLYYAIPCTLLSYFFAFWWSAVFEVPVVK